jgi:hypothetical protein
MRSLLGFVAIGWLLASSLKFSRPVTLGRGDDRITVSARSVAQKVVLEFRARDRLLFRDAFPILQYEGAKGLAFESVSGRGLPDGLVLAVAHQLGADGVNLEAGLYIATGRKVRAIWPKHRDMRLTDAICLGNLGPFDSGLAEIRQDDPDACVMCNHRYAITMQVVKE